MSRLSPNVGHGEVEKPVPMKPPHAKAKERDKDALPQRSHHYQPPSVEPGSTTDDRSRGQDHHSSAPLVGCSHPVSVHHPHPPIPHIPYLWDPRLDPRFAAMEGRLSYNRPIPVNSRTHEGRYHFEPYMNHPVHGTHSIALMAVIRPCIYRDDPLTPEEQKPVSFGRVISYLKDHLDRGYTPGSSPVMSDVSLIRLSPSQRSSNLSTIPEYHYPYMPPHGYVDHLHGSPALSVLSHARGLSPTGSHPGADSHRVTNLGPPLYSHQGLPGDILSQRPSTAGSIEHPALDLGSVEGSRFSSPKPGGRLSRKRVLSISPLSGSFDIDAMIRNSPNSLVAYMNNSRSSSAASGSYGHLSAGTISPLSWHPTVTPLAHLQHLQQQLMRHNRGILYSSHAPGVMPPPAPHYHHHPPANPAMAHLMARANEPVQTEDHLPSKKADQKIDTEHVMVEHNNNLVSSSMDLERKKAEEEEAAMLAGSSTVSSTSHDHHKRLPGHDGDEEGHKDKEEDVPVVTDCEWAMCTRKFQTLEQLVQHINNEHIHNERKEFVCRWTDCIREEKPFKAQYMLVVHMRRHTGEKPHKCTFEGCSKAYSRLENLKTHLRSHTGERPYVCEFQGCTKAFSNASDRAKHQNRTHSNAKPYVCKIPGCTKRYTDPSSLRKHVKTVHGPDAHVTKKMRSDKKDPSSGPKKEDNGPGDPGTPLMVKVEHSPITMKVEDGGSSGHSCQQERIPNIKGDDLPLQSCSTNSMTGQEYSCSPHNDSGVEVEMNVSTGSVGDLTSIDDDKIQDDQISSNMGPPTEGTQGPATTASQAGVRCASPFMVKASKTKGKSTAVNRLAQKVKNVQPLPQLPPIIMKAKHADSKPKDRTVEKLAASERCDSSQSFVGNLENVGPRRGSNTSTISSYLSSRRSSEASPFPTALGISRRSSQTSSYLSSRRTSGVSSQFSTHMGMMNSPYDINSMDSSRRSSEASSLCGPSGLLGLTIQDQRRLQMKYEQTINRQNGWDDRMGPSPSPLPPMAGYRRVSGAASLPPRTPLPHEVPGNEVRRASDPVKMCYDGDVNLPRYNSLNNVAPLPVPDAMRSLQPHPARNMEPVIEGTVYQGGYHESSRMHGHWGNNSHPVGMYHDGRRNDSSRNVAEGQQPEDLVLPDEMVQYLEDQREQTLPQPPMMTMNNMGNHCYPSDYRDRQFQERQSVNMTGVATNGPLIGYGHGMPGKQQQQQQHQQHQLVPNSNHQYMAQQPHQPQHVMPQNQNSLCVPSQPMQMEMSPDCNQVTSTVDGEGMDAMAQGLANLSEDGMDHVQQLVPEDIACGAEMNGNSNVSNMVVNDMSSMLTSLAEENKYLNML